MRSAHLHRVVCDKCVHTSQAPQSASTAASTSRLQVFQVCAFEGEREGGGDWERKKARLRDTYTPPLQPVTRNISDISQDGFINESILYCPLVRIKSTHHRYQLLQTHPIVGLTHPKKWVKPTLKSGSNPSNPPRRESRSKMREGERGGGGHAQRREGESVRERHTQRRSLTRRPPRNKRPHRNKRRRTRRRGWGEEFIRSRKRASLCPIGALE